MTVSSYLRNTANNAIIRDSEKDSIRSSIAVMKQRLNTYFGTDLKEQFIFGSYPRNTILPRGMDGRSDIDYMVVLKDDDVQPQAYLDRLRRFVNAYYSSSEIKQSHPTIQLKLKHITFELVPALKNQSIFWDEGYKIPKQAGWVDTNPNDFNSSLIEKNTEHGSVIKPLVRLMKYWNAQNGYIFDSFSLEKWVIARDFGWGGIIFNSPDLKEYMFQCFNEISGQNLSQNNENKLRRAKEIVKKVEELEADGYPFTAEKTIKKLIPDVNEDRSTPTGQSSINRLTRS